MNALVDRDWYAMLLSQQGERRATARARCVGCGVLLDAADRVPVMVGGRQRFLCRPCQPTWADGQAACQWPKWGGGAPGLHHGPPVRRAPDQDASALTNVWSDTATAVLNHARHDARGDHLKIAALVMAVLIAAPVAAQDQTAVVAQAQADLRAAHIDLAGECGAFAVANLAAWRAHQTDPTMGILKKTAGSGCTIAGQLYAKDINARTTGEHWDVLIASGANGGNGQPAWNADGIRPDITCPCPPGLWAPPVDPALYGFTGATPAPSPAPPPSPAPIDLGPLLTRLSALEQQLGALSAIVDSLTAWSDRVETRFNADEAKLSALEAKPIPMACSASVWGVPIHCALR